MDPIAVIGFSFKFPQGAEDDESFWQMLESGRNAKTTWPETRLNADAFHQGAEPGRHGMASKDAHFFTEDPAVFDAPFFSVTSSEAAAMDPQLRWLLETSYLAMENSGVSAEKASGSETAVFTGTMGEEYLRLVSRDPEEVERTTATGTHASMLANRLSWYFNLKGPSVHLNTACSSSLIAVDLACQALRTGTASMSLVAASNMLLGPDQSIYFSRMNMLSPDGVCYSFDRRANGYGRGEGVAVVVLKRLSDAIRDGDAIRGVVRGSGSNQDGYTPGITQPNMVAQEKLIRSVYERSGIGFDLTRYVEAHGTGTQIGDSTEIKGLHRVFKKIRSAAEPLYVGSVKANIGHLEGCSGLASLIKSILILERGIIPPNPFFEKWNSKLNFRLDSMKVPTSCTTWPTDGLRRISINSFGFGGANAHVVLDDAYHTLQSLENRVNGWKTIPNSLSKQSSPGLLSSRAIQTEAAAAASDARQPVNGEALNENDAATTNGTTTATTNGTATATTNGTATATTNGTAVATTNGTTAATTNGVSVKKESESPSPYYLLVWSAKDEAASRRMSQRYSDYCEKRVIRHDNHHQLQSLAFTLSSRRSIMPWKAFAVVGTDPLPTAIKDSMSRPARGSGGTGLAFIFTGQGAQYAGMGLQLLHFPVFRSALEECERVFYELGAEWSLLDELQGSRIDKPAFSQPLCTALQIGLVLLLESFHIVPDAVVGHSSGEIAAAFTIGALSLSAACKVAYHRGRLAGDLQESASNQGAMLSANLTEADAHAYLEKLGMSHGMFVACINSPSNVTFSGDESLLHTLTEHLERDGIFARKLKTGVAYHSPAMQEISSSYIESLGSLELGKRGISSSTVMISSVTGQRVHPGIVTNSQYWVDNLVSPVRFVDALQYLVVAEPQSGGGKTIHDFVEVGPSGALRRPATDTLDQVSSSGTFQYTPLLSKFDPSVNSTLELVGKLFVSGYAVSIEAANQQDSAQHPSLLVDLPAYPFDHSRSYWMESRLSKNFRRRGPTGTLVGTPAADFNPIKPRWSKMLSMDALPWVADHRIGENVLFPATGTLMMAAEAVMQLASSDLKVSGFHIQEASFLSPIVVQPEAVTEVVTHASLQEHEKTSSRFEVEAFTFLDGLWTRCFRAIICVESEEDANEVDGRRDTRSRVSSRAISRFVDKTDGVDPGMANHVATGDFYQWLHDHGLHYGEAFSRASDISWDGSNLAMARIDTGPPLDAFKGIIHPGVLDSALQLCFTAPSGGMSQSLPTVVPYQIKNGWISANGWRHPSESHVRVVAESKSKSTREGVDASVAVFSPEGSLLSYFERLEMLPVGSGGQDKVVTSNLFHSISWKPHLSLMTRKHLREYCGAHSYEDDKDELTIASQSSRLERILTSVLRRNLAQLQATDWSKSPAHMKTYVSWIESQLRSPETPKQNGHNVLGDEEVDRELLTLEDENRGWRTFLDIAKNLTAIVQGEVDAQKLLESTDDAHGLREELFRPVYHDGAFRAYLGLSAHHNPSQKVLHVGARTGIAAKWALSVLKEIEDDTGGMAFSQYTCTDASAEALQIAEKNLETEKWQGRITLKSLDLEQDLSSQGFEPSTYDLIIASDVLGTTNAVTSEGGAAALQKLHRILKPGGRLVSNEIIPGSFATDFAFGLLPGWWQADEDFGAPRPTMATTEALWDGNLRENGFTGNDLVISDDKSGAEARLTAMVISTAAQDALPAATPQRPKPLIVTNGEDNDLQKTTAAQLQNDLTFDDADVPLPDVVTLEQAAKLGGSATDYVIMLADVGRPFFSRLSQSEMRDVIIIVQKCKNLLWVTSPDRTGDSSPCARPYFALKDGVLRTLRAEFTNKSFTSLDLEDTTVTASGCTEAIRQVFEAMAITKTAEAEYVMRNGTLHSGRLVEDKEVSKDVLASISPQVTTEPWLQGGIPLKLDIGSRGSLETLQLVEDYTKRDSSGSTPTLGPNEVEVESTAWSVNFRDVFGALGRLELAESFGSDCAGTVTRVGSDCSRFKPGDRVCMFTAPSMRTYPSAPEWGVFAIPDGVSGEEACAIMVPALTAWYSLVHVARLEEGEKVLIHSAAGATGQLALQVAKMVGAEIFATVGSKEKKDLVVREFGLPESHVLYSRNTSFYQGVMSLTDGYGVDVVLNSTAGDELRASWDCIAPYGRFVEIGKADIGANTSLPMGRFANNVSFSAVDVSFVGREKKLAKVLAEVMGLFADGKLYCPRPLHIFPVSEAEEAFRYIQRGQNTGRTVIKVEPTTVVQKHLVHRKTWSLSATATYLVAGGLGGIGRSVLKWLGTRGAKHLLVPSRSGAASQEASDTVRELEAQGITVSTPVCDVSSAESLAQMLSACNETMPPIQGCIVATMALNDSPFETMSHPQWDRTVRSKVDASWNLHELLPTALDFFVMLSSISGVVGNAGQSNYAAGCTFQDALASHRVQQGRKAVSIDLGVMRDVGVVAESETLNKRLQESLGLCQIEQRELLATLDRYCDPSLALLSPEKSQVTMGVTTPVDFLNRGLEVPETVRSSLFSFFSQARGASAGSRAAGGDSAVAQFRQSNSARQRADIVVASLSQKLARALSMQPGDIEAAKPLHAFGVDSLIAVELRNWISKEFSSDVPVFELTGGRSVLAIGELVERTSQFRRETQEDEGKKDD